MVASLPAKQQAQSSLSSELHFLFYANASAEIGSGHIMRLLAIAQVCVKQSIKVSFICEQCPAPLQQRLRDEGFFVELYPQGMLPSDLQKFQAQVLFVDDYHLNQSQWDCFQALNILLVHLDDNIDNSGLVSDLIINPAADANENSYRLRAPHANFCLGPQYTYLRQEFAEQKLVMQNANIAEREQILITLGGADVKNMAFALSKALLKKLPLVKICVMLGALNTSRLASLQALANEHANFCLIQQSKNVAKIMSRTGLAVSAAGGTLGELASMGVPTIALVSANNQMPALHSPLLNTWYRAIDVRGYKETIANSQEPTANSIIIEEIIAQVHELWRDLCKRQSMSDYARQIIDCQGCERIVLQVRSALNV